jgi:DNA-binding transcriptional LysR family regulator
MGQGGWPGVHAEPLMDERLFPVCTPATATKLTRAADLVKVPLLHDDDPQTQWVRWLEEAGLEITPSTSRTFSRGARFASSSLLMRAAAAGQGVALARERLAESWLAGGKLVRPFPQTVALGQAYWLVTRSGIEPRRPLRIFATWLKRQTQLHAR